MGVPTVITIGLDQLFKIGYVIGEMRVLGHDLKTFRAASYCKSAILSDRNFETISGELSDHIISNIAFNPGDVDLMPYAVTSTNYCFSKSRISRSNLAGGRNSEIKRLKLNGDQRSSIIGSNSRVCLECSKRIDSGLPVSKRHQSVGDIVFIRNGGSISGVGGNSNIGLPGSKIANL